MFRLRRFAYLPALLVLALACGDAPRDPVAMLVAPEAKAALEVGATLPTVPELVQRVAGGDTLPTELAHAATLWQEASTQGDPLEATQLREAAYALAAPTLAARMDSATLTGVQGRLERWCAAPHYPLPPPAASAAHQGGEPWVWRGGGGQGAGR